MSGGGGGGASDGHIVCDSGSGDDMPIVSSQASVYYFDNDESWKAVDTGLSKVEIFCNRATNQYRVVGVSYKNNAIVIDSQIMKQTPYTQVSATFHRWLDSQHMYGLYFASLKDAEVRRVSSCEFGRLCGADLLAHIWRGVGCFGKNFRSASKGDK
jgi:hypothetical protein